MNKQLKYAHIGDLHITKPGEQNYSDFLAIVSQIERECSNQLDFVFLPGDNADNGLPGQYKMVETALKMLSIPIYIIPGDHDMEQGSLENYNSMKFTHRLPEAITINGYRCIFLDVSGRGKGGPDFRLGDEQFTWLEAELAVSRANKTDIVLFMHTYPADLKDNREFEKLTRLIAENHVVLVNMGHTHYNELANDGQTVYAATRSTGQIEEGPVGYTLVSINDGKVSWRFKHLQDPFPYVLITSPVDYRLMGSNDQKVHGQLQIAATVFDSSPITGVNYAIETDNFKPMSKAANGNYTALAICDSNVDMITLTVQATNDTGRPGVHNIKVPGGLFSPQERAKDGSNKNTIGAWPENGIFGTQLGPNQNGKPSS